MAGLSVCLFVCLASVVSSHSQTGFYFTKSMSIFRRHNEEECRVCFGHDCIPLAEAKCDYYMATSELLSSPEDEEDATPNNVLRDKVDNMIFDLIDRTQEFQALECIPILSTYTDCHKENLCTGCTTCTCDEGRWVCKVGECRAQKMIGSKDVMVALASLKGPDDQFTRKKRATNGTSPSNNLDTKITFEELHAWMQDQTSHPTSYDEEIVIPSTQAGTDVLTTSGPDYLAFDEVLSNIAADNNNISRKKPVLEPIGDEYVSFIDIASDDFNTTHHHKNKYSDNVVIDTKYPYEGDTLKVDLLEDLKNRLQEYGIYNETGLTNEKNKGDLDNFLGDINSLTIVKRDLSNTANVSNVTESIDYNNDTVRDFKNNVLQPLISIIEDKESELNQLHAIKASLIELIKAMDGNFTLDQIVNNTDKNRTLFSIYKLEIMPESQPNTRRAESHSILDMYIKKLKRDVFELIRDLRGIKQSLITNKLPKDLEVLLRALNFYISKQETGFAKEFRQFSSYQNSRRQMVNDGDNDVKHLVYNILQVIDKELAGHDTLNQLSDTSRFVVERIIKQNQIDDFVVYGFKLNNPNYNLTRDLKSIGAKWPELSRKALNSSPPDQLYHMKMLHLMLTVDINKVTDALKLLEFDKNRRKIEDTTASNIEINRVEKDINILNQKIQMYFNNIGNDKTIFQNKDDAPHEEPVATEMTSDVPIEKKSFLKQIKKLFRKSRQDIKNMLHKKVSKSDIVKELAKNKLDEIAKQKMAQYENTLKKWQTRLSGARVKRSKFEFGKRNQMNNILPSYLRGKVRPAIQMSKHKHARQSKARRHRPSSKNKSSKLNETHRTTTVKPKIHHNTTTKPKATKKPKVTKILNGTRKHSIDAKKTRKNLV